MTLTAAVDEAHADAVEVFSTWLA
ncbi:MAG: hypothetical protein JWM19_799, partial [Actinomycetia bacterium]|nr:hypothetical protein [Actinomycetes bacterium]